MRYLKNFNNNAALVEDDSGKEYVIIGNGIGFGKHPGDLVDEGKIERRFVPSDSNTPEIEEFKNIRPQAAETVERINTFLTNKNGWQLNPDDKVYLILHVWRVTHRQTDD